MNLQPVERDYILAKRRALCAREIDIRRLTDLELVYMDMVLDADGQVITFDEFAKQYRVPVAQPSAVVTKEEYLAWRAQYGTRTINKGDNVLDFSMNIMKGVG